MSDNAVAQVQETEAVPTTPTQTREPQRYLLPPVDIYETGDELTVLVDLPGVGKDNIEIGLDNDVLTIRAHAVRGERGNPVYSEFALADYYRQFQLGERVDRDRIAADYRNGVLTLKLPKVEEAKPRRIEIRTA